MFETIVALATAPAKSALAIVRLSGDDCFKIVEKVFTKKINIQTNRIIEYGFIKDATKIIDEVVLLAYKNPHSFTGEDSVEIISHGSVLIANQIIELLIKNGARMATNGEFSSRAFLNGKIDLIQAEAINDMINATTAEAKEISVYALTGETSKIFLPIKDKIGEILSSIEVNIDYPEYEDIEVTTKEQVISVCTEIIDDISKLIETGEQERLYREGLNVAIIGKPNVGKSSLLNSLIKEDKAIVTDVAGTTRDIVEGDFVINGITVHLFDTAGLHESEDKIEKIGINKAINAINKADLILFVIDETGIDENLFKYVEGRKYIVVQNKIDTQKQLQGNYIYVSAKENITTTLINEIKRIMNIGDIVLKPSFNNTRQLGLLKNIVEVLRNAIKDANENQPIDLVATNIMIAYNCSLDLLGQSNKNDLTDEIFSRFCVGK